MINIKHRFESRFLYLVILIFSGSALLQAQQTQSLALKLRIQDQPVKGINLQMSSGGKVSRYLSNALGECILPFSMGEVATIKTSLAGFRSEWIVIEAKGTSSSIQPPMLEVELIPSLPNISEDDPAGPELFYIMENGIIQPKSDEADLAASMATRNNLQQNVRERVNQMLGKAGLHRKEAEKSFAEGNYNGARDQYRRALETFPVDILAYYYDEAQVRQAIAECNRILEKEQKVNENYQLAIKTADALFKSNDFDDAIKVYQQALGFQPGAPYALSQIEKAQELRQGQQANRMIFDLLMGNAAQAEREKSFDRAMDGYTQAQALFPNDKEVNTRIASLKKEIEERDLQYQAAISMGDKLLQGQNYEDALVSYRNARRFKPDEEYARKKIDELTNRLNASSDVEKPDKAQAQEDRSIAKQKETEQKARAQYDQKLAAAGLNIDQKRPDEADRNLLEARTISTPYTWDKTSLDAMSERSEKLRLDLAMDAAYNKALADGKASLASKQFETALIHFTQAVEIDGREEARKLLSETQESLRNSQQTETGYKETMDQGQAAMERKQWIIATQAFENALVFKPRDENASKSLQRAKTEQERDLLIQQGETALTNNDIELAITRFNEAWPMQPPDLALKTRTEELESQHAENIKSRKARYDALIVEADGKWQKKVMDEAIQKYREAIALRPAEEYPKKMIREITIYLEERLVVELNREPQAVNDRTEQRYAFKPLNVRQRKNTYVVISAKNTSKEELKVYLNYGQGKQKNGGIVFKAPVSDQVHDFIIRVSSQYRWYDLNNDWIAVYPEGGTLEVSVVQLATGE